MSTMLQIGYAEVLCCTVVSPIQLCSTPILLQARYSSDLVMYSCHSNKGGAYVLYGTPTASYYTHSLYTFLKLAYNTTRLLDLNFVFYFIHDNPSMNEDKCGPST